MPNEIDAGISPQEAARVLAKEVRNAAAAVEEGEILPAALRRQFEASALTQAQASQDIAEQKVSAVKLKELTGLEERKISRLLAAEGVTLYHRHGYVLREALRVIVKDLEGKDNTTAKAIEKATLRQREADAFTAEAKAKVAAGELALRVDARQVWQDGFAQMRAIIESANYIPMPERRKLVDALLQIKLPTPKLSEVGDLDDEPEKPAPKKTRAKPKKGKR